MVGSSVKYRDRPALGIRALIGHAIGKRIVRFHREGPSTAVPRVEREIPIVTQTSRTAGCPVFSGRIALFYRRHVEPGLRPADLPPLDALLVTHAHYDHLDAASIRALPGSVPVFVPQGLGRWFRRRGFLRVTELVRWDSVEAGPLRITLVPARHWSFRWAAGVNRSLWGGFVVEGGGCAIYHAGDTAWFDGLVEIGRRFPGLLAALLPVGGYTPAWFMEPNHLNPEQAGRLPATGGPLPRAHALGDFQDRRRASHRARRADPLLVAGARPGPGPVTARPGCRGDGRTQVRAFRSA